VFGLASWGIAELTATEATVIPPALVGLAFSLLGMVLGSLVPRPVPQPRHEHHH
jgi:hypothetical protein